MTAATFIHYYLIFALWVSVLGAIIFPIALAVLDYPRTQTTSRWQDVLRAVWSLVFAIVVHAYLYAPK